MRASSADYIVTLHDASPGFKTKIEPPGHGGQAEFAPRHVILVGVTASPSRRAPHFGQAQTESAQPCFESGPIYLEADYLDRRIARHERPRLVHHKDGTTSTDWSQLEDVQFVPGETSYMDWLGSPGGQ